MKHLLELRNYSLGRKDIRRLALLFALLGACYLLLLNLPTRVYEAGDFLGYWSAARLLAQRQNPYDPQALLRLERQQGWQGSDPVYSWNPPWLHVLLLPLSVLPFRPAAALWFLVNPLLIGVSALLLSDTSGPRERHPLAAVPLLAAFLFSRTLHTLLEGQINTLILLGCVCFLVLVSSRKEYLAGAALVLVTVKPHVTYLLLPGILMLLLLRKQARVVAGFLISMLFLASAASYLYPGWLQSYLHLFTISASPLLSSQYATPTVRGLLRVSLGLDIGPWLSGVCLIGFLTLVWARRHYISLPVVVSLSLIIGLPTSPFGWSTDQVVLLIPIILALSWIRELPSRPKWVAAAALFVTYAYALVAWLVRYRDISFLPVPLAVGLIWGYVYRTRLPAVYVTGKIPSAGQQPTELQASDGRDAS
jgi:hypothetical protein